MKHSSDSVNRTYRYSFAENTFFFFRETFSLEPAAAVCFFFALGGGIALPFLNARLPKLVLQGLEEHWVPSQLFERLLLLVILLALVGMAQAGTDVCVQTLTFPLIHVYNLRILKKRMAVDYEVLENRHFHDEAYAAWDSLYRHHAEMKRGLPLWKDFLVAAGCAILFGGILLTQSGIVLALVLLPTLATALLQKKARSYDKRMRLAAESSNRKMDYAARQTSDYRAGKDIRIYNLSGWLLGILRKERSVSEGYVKRWENAYLAANWTDSFLNFLRDSCAYVFLILQIVQGKIAVSDFVWYMAAVANCQQACARLLSQGERLGRLNLDYGRIRRFLNEWNGTAFASRQEPEDIGTTAAAAGSNTSPSSFTLPAEKDSLTAVEIEFRHVSFSYPESQKETLTDLDFTIRPGEKIALVGLNGAGKTTLVKLLCGLYHPTQGEILANGKRIKDYDRETWYRMVSAVFQNVKLLPLSIAQNVASDFETAMDTPSGPKSNPAVRDEPTVRSRVRECLRLAGLLEKVDSLPEKENTSLGRRISPDAIDLSGGELQKLWMARAFYKEAPLLILDEPTAALDPLAEQEVYEKYQEMSAGKTSLFISHRLSSTSFCDRIFFMENGQITETGSHQALLEKGGSYARLYRIQSQYYTKGEQSAWTD